ncbi:MAG: hypothetical protein Q8O35_10135 [Humidesulfovibrio sp.]|uniref:hypothetical protein n=1 Tax=Humidesulfovibrio sp. TaxID=2910988 RepID=UPI002735C358|nr:hypothetical protein [Humidesulfovibrio sp.]MDP2848536.1 hypothetical protein [Humidesulfovibrio sp.]
MAVQMMPKQSFMREPGVGLGLLAYITATLSCMMQTRWRLGYTELETFVIPAVPWFLNVCLFLKFRGQPLKQYWWILPTVFIANPILLVLGLMVLAWSIGGFV